MLCIDKSTWQLSLQERLAYLWMYSLMLVFPNKEEMFGWMLALANAWGFTERRMYSKYVAWGFKLERKELCDKCETVFNSEAKRRVVFTPLMSYKKEKSRELRDSPDRLEDIALQNEFKQLSPRSRLVYNIRANNMLIHSRFLHGEIIELLKNTHGMVNFREAQPNFPSLATFLPVHPMFWHVVYS